ncbi:MAG TPA: sulfatase-like hydrolase/transferase [Bacteroidota bacterium]|nr:sulfatase-like hydrolase/transferase [Bacteroidota bacterium]
MKRREFIKIAGVVAGTAAAGKSVWSQESPLAALAADRRPNIIIITTDQQSADALSCRMGSAFLKTPAMDSLARRGTFFTRAYAANPLCIPSRTSMLTGQPPHVTGIQTNDNQASLVGKFRTYGTIFRDAGYDTGYFGKWHLPFPVADKNAHGFETTGAIKNDGIDKDVPPLAAQFMMQKRDKPFLLVTSFVNPHNVCEWPRGEEMKNGPVGDPPPLDQCPPAVPNLSPMKDEPDIIPLIKRSFQANRLFPVGNFDEKKWREYRWVYFRLIEKVDAHIGKVLHALRESGQEENTVIIFTSDHGDCQGAHGWNQKTVLFDESSRVPFIIVDAGAAKGSTCNILMSTGIDLLPTMCDYAGIKAPANLIGISLKPAASGAAFKSRPYVVAEDHMVQGDAIDGYKPEPNGRMVRSERFKYYAYDLGKQREALVDMEQDPGELVNLALKKEYRKVLEQHRQYLSEWCRQTNDPFVVPG